MESKLDRLKSLRNARGFRPIELTEGNVNSIYDRCLATEKTSKEDIVGKYLFTKNAGFEDDSGLFYMSKTQLQNNRSEILYLLGQLYDIHVTDDGFIYLKNFSLNYNKLPWFETSKVDEVQKTIFNLISLGTAAENERGCPLISNIIRDKAACMAAEIMPTLSPNDPKFEEWANSEKGKKLLLTFKSRDEGEQK